MPWHIMSHLMVSINHLHNPIMRYSPYLYVHLEEVQNRWVAHAIAEADRDKASATIVVANKRVDDASTKFTEFWCARCKRSFQSSKGTVFYFAWNPDCNDVTNGPVAYDYMYSDVFTQILKIVSIYVVVGSLN